LFVFRFQRRFKLILLFLLTVATVMSLWFSLSIYGIVPRSYNPLNFFISYAAIVVCTFCAFPIYYEAIVENTYPVPEGKHELVVITCAG